MEENEIYKFFKENNLTQLDESSFIKKYSDPKESAKLHSFMTENNLTTKEPSVFHNDYFVKKKESSQETTDQSSVSTPSDIGLDSPSVSQTEQVQDSPNQEQSLRAVSDTQSPWQTSPSREGGFTAQDIDFEQAEKDALIKAAQTQIKVQEDAKDPNSPWSKNIFKSQEDTEKARVEDFQKDYAKNLKESILNQIPEDLRGSQTFEQTLKEQGVNLDITGEGKIGNRNILESAGNALKKGGSDLFFTMAWLSNQQNPALKLALETKKKEVGYDLSKKINTYEKNFTESLGSGDFENASGILLNTLGESAPVMVAAATTGSLGALPSMGVLSGITGAQEYLNVKDEKWFNEMSNLGKVGYVSAMGGFEGFGEMMGGRVINRIAKDVVKQGFTKTTKSSLSQMLKGAAKSYGVNMSEEALGEAVTSAGQYLAGKIAKGEEINWSEFLKQTFEGGALGAAMGSGFTTVGNVARTAYGMAKKSKPVIAAEEKVERIKEEVKTAETQAEKEATTKAAAKAIEEKQSVFKEEKAKAEKISEEDRTAIAEKDAQIDSKQAELEGLANKPETAKYVQDEITTLQNEISEIENKYEQQEAIEDATQEQALEQARTEATGVLEGERPSDTVESRGKESRVDEGEVEETVEIVQEKATKPEQGKKVNSLFGKPVAKVKEIANKFKKVAGIKSSSGSNITEIDVDNAKSIADAYDAMKHDPTNPEVAEAYEAMAKETLEQYNAIEEGGVKFEIYEGKGEPYKNSKEMLEDLEKGHLFILSTEADFGQGNISEKQRKENPLLRDSGLTDVNGKPLLVNDIFRGVHDFFGHGERGNSFGAKGEENAWDVHSRMYSPKARRAMTTETRGQNSWVNFGKQMRNEDGSIKKKGDEGYMSPNDRPFAEQKVGLLPKEISENNYEKQEQLSETTKETPTSKQGLKSTLKKVFGLEDKKAQATSTIMDRVVGNIAKRAGIAKEEAYKLISYGKAEKAPKGSLKQEESREERFEREDKETLERFRKKAEGNISDFETNLMYGDSKSFLKGVDRNEGATFEIDGKSYTLPYLTAKQFIWAAEGIKDVYEATAQFRKEGLSPYEKGSGQQGKSYIETVREKLVDQLDFSIKSHQSIIDKRMKKVVDEGSQRHLDRIEKLAKEIDSMESLKEAISEGYFKPNEILATNSKGDRILFQGEKGSMLASDGKFLINAITNPNVSTPVHEIAHVYEHYLTKAEKAEIQKWAGHKEWSVETSEKFARGFEKYLATGKAPDSRLKKAFDNFKNWLTEIYNGIKGSDIDVELSPKMEKMYQDMVKLNKKQGKSETTKETTATAKQPQGKEQSAKAAPAEKSEKSESSSKESQKEKPLRPIESSSKKDDVKPANEFEEGKKAAKEEARKKAEENKVISKRKKLTNAVKRKVKGNKYTNINNNVSSLVELPLHKVKDKKLAEELDKVLTDLNRGRVALYKGEDLSKLKERAEADIAKNEVVKETLKDSKAINGVVERVDKKIEGLKKLDSVKETEGTAAKELTSLEKEVGTLSSSLEKAKERNEQLRDLEEISQAEYEITKKNIKESEKLLEERLNELGVKKEKVTEKLNNASKDNLGKINESWMTPEQKDAYERFKDEVESEKDLSKAEDVFVMTEDLVNEYFPVSEMSRYTISKKNEKGGNRLGKAMESNKARRNKLFNLPPSGLTTKVRIKKLLNILAGRTAGTLGFGNLKTETGILSYLKSRDLSQLEEMALMIKDGTLTKEVIDPILSAFTRADNTRDNALENYYNVLEKGIVSKVRNGASIKEAVESSKKESFRAGVYLMQKHIESEYGVKDYLVRLAASTSMQRYSRWEKKIIEEMSLNASSKKNYSKLSSKEKALAKEGRKIFDEQKSKVDYIQDLRGVRRQDFAEYMPLNRRVGQRSKTTEETLSKDDVVGNAMNPKIAAGNAKRRESIVKSDGDVYAYEMNLSKALERLVTETTRDYEMTEAIREIRGVLKEAQKNENLDRTTKEYLAAIEKRVYDSVKKHFNRPYSKSEGIVDKLTSAFYALKLNVPDRIVTEVATEMYRISMMGDVGNVKEAISQLEQRIDVSINNALKPKKDRKTTDVEKLMVHTGSSFLKNTVKHQGETKQKYRGEKGFGKMNAAVGAIPDMLTMNNVWMPAFRAEFEKVTGGDKFDLAEFSRSKAYREKYKKEMLEAKAIAERETARLKGSTLKGGSKVASPHAFTKIRRLFGDETATGFSTLSEKDSERIAAKLNSVMASFGARESARFGREMADIQLSDSYKDKGMAAKNAFVQFSSGVMYGALRGYTGLMMLSFILGMDDDESEFEKGINEQLDNYWSGEFVYESAKSNALFIASSPYGQSSRALALGAAGIRVLALEDEKLGKSKSEKKEIDKKIENIEESTKLTFFAKPTTDTESILKAILPQVSEFGYPAVETAIDLISDIDYESNADLTKEEVQAIQYLTTLNNVQRIFFAYKGTQLPLVQRDVNRILDNYKYKIKKRKKKSKGMKGTSIGGN